jgi:hydrogenase nickel incorporation protein HypA/HybF
MHESHIVQPLIKSILETAAQHKATKITRVTIAMGEMSGFDESSVKLHFETMGEGTMLEKAEIVVHKLQSKLVCGSCRKEFIRTKGSLTCPDCGAPGSPSGSGQEFYIEDIEIE